MLFAVLFTFSVELIGVYVFREGQHSLIPVFNTEAYVRYLPLVWGFTALSIMKESVKMIFRKWTRGVMLIHIAFNLAVFILLVIMLKDPTIWNPHFIDQLVQLSVLTPGSEAFEWIQAVSNEGGKWFISIAALVTVIDMAAVCLKVYPIHRSSIDKIQNL
ncbi:hypothetical protein D3C77_483070 [compost metagenome]